MERRKFRIVSGKSPEILRKLRLSTNIYARKLGGVTIFYAVNVPTTQTQDIHLKDNPQASLMKYRSRPTRQATKKKLHMNRETDLKRRFNNHTKSFKEYCTIKRNHVIPRVT